MESSPEYHLPVLRADLKSIKMGDTLPYHQMGIRPSLL